MKKVGIVTVYGEQNYGNKLQNYALMKLYKKLGYAPATLQVRQSALKLSSSQKAKNLIKAAMSLTPTKSSHAQYYRRERAFKGFSEQFLNLSKPFYTDNVDRKFLESFDILSVGSDQVWNDVDFNTDDVKYFSLLDVKGPKKISYAASIGKKEFQARYKNIFVRGLNDFDFISCREKAAVEYLNSILKQECYLVMDPTLFLSGDQWAAIEKKPEWFKDEKYCLSYFLGGSDESVLHALTKDTKCIDLMNVNGDAFISSPQEFIFLIHHAQCIYTDSFHACVFSMLFRRDFEVFKRQNAMSNMNSRIDTLFQEFSVNGKIGQMVRPFDYDEFSSIVEDKRKYYEKLIVEQLDK